MGHNFRTGKQTMIRTILNEKGGVAKTTTAIQLAAGFAKAGRKTLLIDGDPQGGATKILFSEDELKEIMETDQNTISEVMLYPDKIRECIRNTGVDNLYMIPGNGALNRTINKLRMNPMTSYPVRLKKALKLLGDEYEEIVIDNNPFFTLFSMNTVVCADEVIIPTDIDLGSLAAVTATMRDIADIIDEMGDAVNVDVRILLTMVDRLKIDRTIIEQVRTAYKQRIYSTTIRTQNKPVKEANFSHTLLINDEKSAVAQDYRNFISEVLGGQEA